MTACDDIFRDSSMAIIGCFAKNLDVTYAFQDEIVGMIMGIEIANRKG
ncbi:hypothetical protein A2U01_0055333 [Trifolium medium]|uniref:Uncharacterized protein n=1 Tax=Trifolium medium TaxID=97028 RepID=A0A392REV0_9FABA|nr:hypothetical protein [Trifolium medium]